MSHNRDSVAEVLERVRRREMTPREAELLWDEQGQESPIATKSPGGLPRVVWPFSLAFAWIAWRSDAVLEREWERLRFWGVTLEGEAATAGQVMTISDARRELADALLAGRIIATGIGNDQSIRTPIETVEWPELVFEPGGSPNILSKGWVQLRWHDVRVDKTDVRRIWPETLSVYITPTVHVPELQSTTKHVGGRVLAEHWHDMWAEVCRIIHEEGVPVDRLTIVKRMQQWFADRNLEAPASQKLNPIMERLFKALGR